MRFIKMLGLTVVAAVAAMAVVGASSAMATGSTALCNTNTNPCSSVFTGHIEGTATNPELSGKFFGVTGKIICEKSVILGNALGLGKPQVTHLELVDFTGNCHLLAPFVNEPCSEVKAVTPLGLVDLLRTAANLGEATSLGNNVSVKCGGFISCVLGGEPKFHALGSEGSLASLTSPTGGAVVSNVSGTNCPEGGTSRWTAKYSIGLPDSLFISE